MMSNINYEYHQDILPIRLYRTHSINSWSRDDLHSRLTSKGMDCCRVEGPLTLPNYGYLANRGMKTINGENDWNNCVAVGGRLKRSASLHQKQLHVRSGNDVNHGDRVLALMLRGDAYKERRLPGTVKWSQAISLDRFSSNSNQYTFQAPTTPKDPLKDSHKIRSSFDGSQFNASLFKKESRDGITFGLVSSTFNRNPSTSEASSTVVFTPRSSLLKRSETCIERRRYSGSNGLDTWKRHQQQPGSAARMVKDDEGYNGAGDGLACVECARISCNHQLHNHHNHRHHSLIGGLQFCDKPSKDISESSSKPSKTIDALLDDLKHRPSRKPFVVTVSSDSLPRLMSPTIVKEVMKTMANGSSDKFNDETGLKDKNKASPLKSNGKVSKSSPTIPIKGSIQTEQINGDKLDENDQNQVNSHMLLEKRPSKPPRKPSPSDVCFEQQTDNLVEEIYLTAEPGPRIKDNPPKVQEQCEISEKSSNSKHFVVVAIDFGTTYSGYAFSFTRSPEAIHMMRKWDDGGTDPDVNNHKTPTILLLKPNGDFAAFGTAAREVYHGLTAEEAKEWFYFEKFKMALHTAQSLTKKTELQATNGKKMAALAVFGHSLRFFKNHALEQLSEQCAIKISDENVRWVVTVPALWRQTAKQFMRMAAYQAGLASPDNPSQLLISPEPEAAAIYCRKLKIDQLIPEVASKNCHPTSTTNNNSIINGSLFDHEKLDNKNQQAISIKKGTRYMVVDCGGGTVDTTVHEIHDDLRSLKELHRASGCPFGSMGVDREFEALLEDIFGDKFMDEFRCKLPSGWVTLMATFEGRKRATNTISSTPYNIALPFSFIQSVRKWKGSGVGAIVKKYGKSDVSFDPRLGILRLSSGLMRKLFEPTCEKIVSHINSLLESKNCRGLGYLFLVGGFAESQLLQSYIRSAFSSRLRVIIPQGVSSTILRGAVLFGLDPSIISVRRSKMTYGIGILNRFIHGYHPLSKLVVRDGIEWCCDIFDKFVLTDQSIAAGDIVTRSYTPAKTGQKFSVLNIYCSERDDVRFITDDGVQRCGTLVLDLDDCDDAVKDEKKDEKPQSPKSKDDKASIEEKDKPSSTSSSPPEIIGRGREIQTLMTFGETEIKVCAVDVQSGRKVRAEVDFLSQ